MAKIGWGRVLAGVATAAAAGAAYVYFKQRAARAPLYETLASDGAFAIRRYPALLVIETVQHGTRDRALGNGFGLLAGYMFGDGREGEELPITMPVIAVPLPEGAWRIRFLLPQGIDRSGLEEPGQGITIAEVPARDVGVITVPGKPGDRLFTAKANELRRWIKAQGRGAEAGVEHAYYNSPLKPGKPLPNEIFVPLTA
jgi:hypothetical protein